MQGHRQQRYKSWVAGTLYTRFIPSTCLPAAPFGLRLPAGPSAGSNAWSAPSCQRDASCWPWHSEEEGRDQAAAREAACLQPLCRSFSLQARALPQTSPLSPRPTFPLAESLPPQLTYLTCRSPLLTQPNSFGAITSLAVSGGGSYVVATSNWESTSAPLAPRTAAAAQLPSGPSPVLRPSEWR